MKFKDRIKNRIYTFVSSGINRKQKSSSIDNIFSRNGSGKDLISIFLIVKSVNIFENSNIEVTNNNNEY